ncbi:hypothetical protein NDU88_008407 [Pleurodeles waltl]|uniref:Uncharacterized protein n=1 Tax=Pleurodeles waltl TaxID=8319 RepID=A0AAV7N767_PLEWA|nr:hypothetical protein NDU88_008407 [Pleurodeles waltl]
MLPGDTAQRIEDAQSPGGALSKNGAAGDDGAGCLRGSRAPVPCEMSPNMKEKCQNDLNGATKQVSKEVCAN